MKITLDAFLNITNISFLYFDDEASFFVGKFRISNRDLKQNILNKILKIINVNINFKSKTSTFFGSDEDFTISSVEAHKYSKEFSVTPVDFMSYDIETIEDILRKNEDIASCYYPLFASIGYTLLCDEGRWKIIKNKKRIDYKTILEFYQMAHYMDQ